MFSYKKRVLGIFVFLIFYMVSSAVLASFQTVIPSTIKPGSSFPVYVSKLPGLQKVYAKFNDSQAVLLDYSLSSRSFVGIISVPEHIDNSDSRVYITGIFNNGSVYRDYHSVSIQLPAPVMPVADVSVGSSPVVLLPFIVKSFVFLLAVLFLLVLVKFFIKQLIGYFPFLGGMFKWFYKPLLMLIDGAYVGVSWSIYAIKQFPVKSVTRVFSVTVGCLLFLGVCLSGCLLGIYLFVFIF